MTEIKKGVKDKANPERQKERDRSYKSLEVWSEKYKKEWRQQSAYRYPICCCSNSSIMPRHPIQYNQISHTAVQVAMDVSFNSRVGLITEPQSSKIISHPFESLQVL